MLYPSSYHGAMAHLIAYGPWHNRAVGRRKVARALRDLRRALGHEAAQVERRHMAQVGGMMPAKESHPLVQEVSQ